MEALQKAIEPLQDAILKLAKLAAKLEGVPLQEANESLTDFRKSDKELRERLFVCQVAKPYGWEDANKMARRKAGDYEDPELAKVLEEREKKLEKAKRNQSKAEASGATKRKYQSSPGSSKGGRPDFQYRSPLSNNFNSGGAARSGGYGNRPQQRAELNCFICGQAGHLFKFCPDKKK